MPKELEGIDGAVATLEKAAARFDDGMEKLDSIEADVKSVKVVQGDLKNELHQIKEAAKAGVPYEQVEPHVVKFLEKKEADDAARGVMSPHAEAELKGLTDPWNDRVDYLAWKGRKGDIEDKEQFAINVLESVIRSAPTDDLTKHFQHMATDAMIMDALGMVGVGAKKWLDPRGGGMRKHLPNVYEKWNDYKRAILSRYMGKAAGAVSDTATATNVSEWVPVAWSPELRSKIISRSRLLQQMPRIFYGGPGKTYDLPIDLTDPVADLVTEATTYAQAVQNPLADPWQMANPLVSAKKTFTFFLTRTRFLYSGMVEEDSMVPVVPLIRSHLELGHAQGEEKCWIDGQKSAAIDTGDVPGTYDIRNGADGFRKYTKAIGATAEVDHSNADITSTAIMSTLRAKLGEAGLETDDLFLLVAPSVFYKMTTLAEVWTMEKFPNPTIVSGTLAALGGIQIIPSRYVRTDLDATGIYANAGTVDRTVAILVNRRGWLAVEKRDMTIESARYAATDTNDVLAMRRYDLGNILGSNQITTATLYNVKR